MTPIPTTYKGVTYRSKTEARWAVFFDKLGVPVEWEPQGFDFGAGLCYLPDFFVPSWNLYVEVKSDTPTPLERAKAQKLADVTNCPVWLVIGAPHQMMGKLFVPGGFRAWAEPENVIIGNCGRCSCLTLLYRRVDQAGIPFTSGYRLLGPCQDVLECHCRDIHTEIPSQTICDAMSAAQSERFGVYEEPKKGAA